MIAQLGRVPWWLWAFTAVLAVLVAAAEGAAGEPGPAIGGLVIAALAVGLSLRAGGDRRR